MKNIKKFIFSDFQEKTDNVNQNIIPEKLDEIKEDVLPIVEKVDSKNTVEAVEQIVAIKSVTKEEDSMHSNLKQYSEEEISTIRQKEFKRGWEEASKENLNILKEQTKDSSVIKNQDDKTKDTEEILLQIQNKFDSFYEEVSLRNSTLIQDCADLSYAMAEKILNKALRKFSKDIIIDFLNEHLPKISNLSDVNVNLNKNDYEKMKLYIYKNKDFFHNKINFIVDKGVKIGDCYINWKYGSIKKNSDYILKEFESLLVNYFSVNQYKKNMN